ncbi:hypothetical protein BC629DRAFT_1078140 [Irpex lacteus]|nr:hypothetical protein BC629DRAFT_1078140 [Irpex lacteus]
MVSSSGPCWPLQLSVGTSASRPSFSSSASASAISSLCICCISAACTCFIRSCSFPHSESKPPIIEGETRTFTKLENSKTKERCRTRQQRTCEANPEGLRQSRSSSQHRTAVRMWCWPLRDDKYHPAQALSSIDGAGRSVVRLCWCYDTTSPTSASESIHRASCIARAQGSAWLVRPRPKGPGRLAFRLRTRFLRAT